MFWAGGQLDYLGRDECCTAGDQLLGSVVKGTESILNEKQKY
jgi:hypothetical protein